MILLSNNCFFVLFGVFIVIEKGLDLASNTLYDFSEISRYFFLMQFPLCLCFPLFPSLAITLFQMMVFHPPISPFPPASPSFIFFPHPIRVHLDLLPVSLWHIFSLKCFLTATCERTDFGFTIAPALHCAVPSRLDTLIQARATERVRARSYISVAVGAGRFGGDLERLYSCNPITMHPLTGDR